MRLAALGCQLTCTPHEVGFDGKHSGSKGCEGLNAAHMELVSKFA